MNPLRAILAFGLVALLLAAPAAATCDALSSMSPHCPMLETAMADAYMAGMESCHSSSVSAGECCGVSAPQEPLGALSRETGAALTAPSETAAPAARASLGASFSRPAAAGDAVPPERDRYKLLSSFLL